jgi:hypothetical protein
MSDIMIERSLREIAESLRIIASIMQKQEIEKSNKLEKGI